MQAIRRILVVVDPRQPDGQALERARQIAAITHAHLHLLACEPGRNHIDWLETLRATLAQSGHSVSAEQAWQDNLPKTVLQAQQAQAAGLVVKQHLPDSSLSRALLTPDDWKLLRLCACPVLMVKSTGSWSGRNILAAVDTGSDNAGQCALQTRIVALAAAIADAVQGHLHVLTAHPSPMLSPADPAFQSRQSLRQRYHEACRRFESTYALTNEQLHIEEGPADALIPELAKRLEAAVTVIGTVARSGLPGVLMGNTAEVVLDALNSDVLVVKPADLSQPSATIPAHT